MSEAAVEDRAQPEPAGQADADKPAGGGGALDLLGGVDFLATLQGAASKLVNIAEERDARERGCVCEARGKGDPLEVYAFRPGVPPTLLCALWAEIPRVLGMNAQLQPPETKKKSGLEVKSTKEADARTSYWWSWVKEEKQATPQRNAVEVMLQWLTNQPCFEYPLTKASAEIVGAEWCLMQWPTKDPWPNKPGADYDFKYTYVYESDHYDAIAKKTIVAKNRRAPEVVTQLLLSDTGGPTAIHSATKSGPLVEPDEHTGRACFVWPDGNTLVTFPGNLWNTVLAAKGPGDAPFPRNARFATQEEPRLCLQINWWSQRPGCAKDLPLDLHSDCATCAFDLAVGRTPYHEGGPEPDALVPAGLEKKNMVERIVAKIAEPETNMCPTCTRELSSCFCTVEKPPPKGIHLFIMEKPPHREYDSDSSDFD